MADHGSAFVQRTLIFGDVARQYTVAAKPSVPLIVVELAPEPGDRRVAVEYLPADATVSGTATTYRDDLTSARTLAFAEPAPVWDGLGFTVPAEQVFRTLPETTDLGVLSPLMLLRIHRNGATAPFVEVLTCSRLRASGVLLTRVAQFTVPERTVPTEVQLVREGLSHLPALREFVASDFSLYTRFEPGIEIELKFLITDEVSPWGLAARIAREVGNGAFPGFIPDVGNEHQRWETRQVTYAVESPTGEAGYIGLTENNDGLYTLKRKRFVRDGLRREETFRLGLDIPKGTMDAFIAAEYPQLSVKRLPAFSRAKFDVNVESVTSGHFFGIEIDEVTIEGHGAVMRQAEIEYHRSRVHEGLNSESIDHDLDRLAGLVESILKSDGISAERTFYSKLSFLRDVVAGTWEGSARREGALRTLP